MNLLVQFLPELYAALILAITALVARLASYVVGRGMRQSAPQVAAGARRLGAVIVWLIGGIFAIQEVGINSDILLLVIALAGVAVLVALREQLENFGAKYFTDIYSPYKVGDSIRVREFSGKVIEINATSTVLITGDDQLVSIPNSIFMTEVLVNTSPQAWKELTVPFTLGSGVDLPLFESELLKRLGKLRLRLDRRYPPVLALKSRSAQGTELTLTIMIRRPEERDALSAEVVKRVGETIQRFQLPRPKPVEAKPEAAPPPAKAPAAPPAKASE
ncbi:MAG: mechanosensitive ion channel family protein [Thermoplasmata archaeon]|nr:mechanosensitive ion channel family protein [Thermoplasmata archaeon]